MADWEEPGGLVVAFVGINNDEHDKIEMENFSRGLKAPAKEDPGGKAFATNARMRSRAMTPMDVVKFALGAVVGLVGYLIAGALGLPPGTAWLVFLGCFFVGYLITYVVTAVLTQKAQPVARSAADTFRITLSSYELAVEGQTTPRVAIPIAEIDRFDGRGKLTVLRRDGSSVVLPCSLKSRFHGDLAGRLDELLRKARGQG
jgi:hypothetical protein